MEDTFTLALLLKKNGNRTFLVRYGLRLKMKVKNCKNTGWVLFTLLSLKLENGYGYEGILGNAESPNRIIWWLRGRGTPPMVKDRNKP